MSVVLASEQRWDPGQKLSPCHLLPLCDGARTEERGLNSEDFENNQSHEKSSFKAFGFLLEFNNIF
jgi:hypothetical protein